MNPQQSSSGEDPSINDVVVRMDTLLSRARKERSRIGFFLALYRRVTLQVREGIATGRFEDGARMERFAVLFAQRYLDAADRFERGEVERQSWPEAFEVARSWRPIILQHLLIGINVHINLDLGIAAAQTSPGSALAALQHDFDEIGAILSELVDDAQERLAVVSPWLGFLDSLGGRTDEAIVQFSLRVARDAAWGVAENLATRPADEWASAIDALDESVALRGRGIRSPGFFLSLGVLLIRVAESRNVRRIIDVLAAP